MGRNRGEGEGDPAFWQVNLRTKLHIQGPFVGCTWDKGEKAEVVREPFPDLLPYSPQAGGEGEEEEREGGGGRKKGKEGKEENMVQFSKITDTKIRDSIKGGALMGSREQETQANTEVEGWFGVTAMHPSGP